MLKDEDIIFESLEKDKNKDEEVPDNPDSNELEIEIIGTSNVKSPECERKEDANLS